MSNTSGTSLRIALRFNTDWSLPHNAWVCCVRIVWQCGEPIVQEQAAMLWSALWANMLQSAQHVTTTLRMKIPMLCEFEHFSHMIIRAVVTCGRLSWIYDLQGPIATVDTACSSTLIATHQ
eukprot:2567571-Amphidinium_carterae.1